MKVGPVTKVDKRDKTTSKKKKKKKKMMMTSCHKIVTPLSLFQFTDNLEQSRSSSSYA